MFVDLGKGLIVNLANVTYIHGLMICFAKSQKNSDYSYVIMSEEQKERLMKHLYEIEVKNATSY